jgi:ABC-type nickel/cobalt efflux system permease component RcnA
VAATITLPAGAVGELPAGEPHAPTAPKSAGSGAIPESKTPAASVAEDEAYPSGLLDLFDAQQYSFPVLLLVAAVLGAAHALTPGHGKTLVAAYLVGERGTVLHALVLGLVTTLTHTSVVIILALVLFLVPMDEAMRQAVQSGLGLSMGLVVVCLGFWLLLQRASGRADHVHIGGHGHHHHGHHHHDHTHADHHHDEHGNVVPQAVGWWGLIILGMSGGIVPCWDAIALLMVAIAGNLIHLALPLVLAFSAGLAGVLVAIGILVVKVKGFATSHTGDGTLTRWLPIVSAVLLVGIGFWLCYDAVHGVH